jgi:nucleoside-diphosphate-sugar epimerase
MVSHPIPASNGKTVLITGINGYIASTLGHLLLTKGYLVRGTTRSASSVQDLLSGAYAPYASRIEIAIVPDMTLPGAFDSAVAGVHGIFHTASPIGFGGYNYESMLVPAVKGTETLLNSALTHAGPQLESVVITSSVASVVDPKPAPSSPGEPGYVYTEADFATTPLVALEAAHAEGKNTENFPGLYQASKMAAERAAWAFRSAHKPQWSISTIHPSVTVGPPVQLPSAPSQLNATLEPIWTIFSGGPLKNDIGSGSFVDVRDVALMHAWAYEHARESDGERYIACAGFGPLQAVADILREAYPDRRSVVQEGTPGTGYDGWDAETGTVREVRYPMGRISVSGAKAERVMGIKFRNYRESVLDTARSFEKYL